MGLTCAGMLLISWNNKSWGNLKTLGSPLTEGCPWGTARRERHSAEGRKEEKRQSLHSLARWCANRILKHYLDLRGPVTQIILQAGMESATWSLSLCLKSCRQGSQISSTGHRRGRRQHTEQHLSSCWHQRKKDTHQEPFIRAGCWGLGHTIPCSSWVHDEVFKSCCLILPHGA